MAVIRKWLRIADNSAMSGYREIAESGTANQFVVDGLEEDTTYYADANVENQRGVAQSTQANFTTLETNYLCFTDTSGSPNTLTLTKVGRPDDLVLEVSSDKINWNTWTQANNVRTYNIPANEKVYVRGNNVITNYSNNGYYHVFSSVGNVSCSGSVMTLIDKSDNLRNATYNRCFSHLFYQMTTLTTAPELPATTLSLGCYYYMFGGCTSLTTPPTLPAMTTEASCYECMFRDSGLVTPPALPALTINGSNAYAYMFNGCSSLVSSPTLPATSLNTSCYNGMFANCTSLTTANPIAAQITGTNTMQSMFYGCTSLTSTPTMTVADFYNRDGGLRNMFFGCTSLTDSSGITITATSFPSNACYAMFSGCTALTNAPTITVTEMGENALREMYLNCESLVTAPTITIGEIGIGGMRNMFSGCNHLSNVSGITISATDFSNEACCGMFRGCTALTNVVPMTINTIGDYSICEMYYGCSNLSNVSGLVINATTYGTSSCNSTFYNCTALPSTIQMVVDSVGTSEMTFNSMYRNCTTITSATNIQLNATTVNKGTYKIMFYGCTSLVHSPQIKATTYYSNSNENTNGSFSYMYSNCTSLDDISVAFTDWQGGYGTSEWTRGCKANGTFYCPSSLTVTKNASGNTKKPNYIPYNWNVNNGKTNSPTIIATRTQSSIHGQVWSITITPPDYGSSTLVTTYYVVSRDGRDPTTASTSFQAINGTPYTFDVTIVTKDYGTHYAKCYSVVSGMGDSDIITYSFTTL